MIKAFTRMRWSRRASAMSLIVLTGLSSLRCGGGGGAAAPTQPVVVAPPPATPTPVPTPTADPPLSLSCTKLPPGNANAGCRVQGSEYGQVVDDAIRTLQAEQPAIFDDKQVLSSGAYYVGLIKILDRQGICAEFDGEELAVTDNAGWNEQFHVLTSSSRARFSSEKSYRTTCTPSVIPTVAAPLPPSPAGCPLNSSREITCGREGDGRYIDDVTAAIEQVMKEKPELFDYSQVAAGLPSVKSLSSYHGAVVDVLVKKGYCAKDDGEEIGVKRGSNTFSEQFDINLSDKYVRMGPGIYRTSCYPAAF
jgi:hypothetical protein